MLQCSRSIVRCKRNRIINTVSLCSSQNIHFLASKSHRYINYRSNPVGFSWTGSLFVIMSNSIGFCRSLSIQASPSKDQVSNNPLDEVLLAIKQNPSSIDSICFSYVSKLCKSGNLSTAANLLQSLRSNHIFVSPNLYNIMLEYASEGRNVDIVTQTFKHLIVFSESLSSTTYLYVAKAFTNTHDNLLLISFLIDILEVDFPKRVLVINRVIYAFAELRQLNKALLVFHHMKSLKCKPNHITYNIVLDILGRAGRVDEMIHEFASMKKENIVPDIVSYNTLINSLRKVGRLDLSLVFLQEMVEIGIKPDLRTYTALIESFGHSGNVEESMRLYREMKKKHIRPSIYIYRSLIKNLKKMGKLELAMSFSKEMDLCFPDLVGPEDFKAQAEVKRGR